MNYTEVMKKLRVHPSRSAIQGMNRYGIRPRDRIYGLSIPEIRNVARQVGTDHALAQRLWKTKVHEAKLLAPMVDDPQLVTEEQMENWVKDFDSWDTCDGCCGNLFDKTRFSYKKAVEWSSRNEEFVKRAGYVLMATLAVHDKTVPDAEFLHFLPYISSGARDERNFVKKAVSWALRQLGKRNRELNSEAIRTAELIRSLPSASAKWIAVDALRELRSPAVQARLGRK